MQRFKFKGKNIVAMIPARMGSTRLAMKNMALISGKPLIYYPIQAAKESGVFTRIVVNSEDTLFQKIAKRYGAEFYKRPKRWATSKAKSDRVVYDFLKENPCDIIAWVNPTSPLQGAKEIRDVVTYFVKSGLDSLITVKNEQVHCLHKGRPINFKIDTIFSRTQDLVPVQPFVYSIMIWRRDLFMKTFERNGHAFFCGRFGTYPVSKLSAVIVKSRTDLMMVQSLIKGLKRGAGLSVRYDRILSKNRA
ncbi:MAG: hypothetical protein ABID09_04420 [Candidatus Omnitrophota bacterium]